MDIKLEAKTRLETGKSVKKLRRLGFVPAVVYGQGAANVNIAVASSRVAQVLKEAGESTLLELQIEGDPSTRVVASKTRNVLIHAIQTDPVRDFITHVDFMEVRMDQKIKAGITVMCVGEAPAVKELGGILVRNIHELEVEALPRDLPHHLEADISAIKTFEDHVKVADIKLTRGVKILADKTMIVVSVVPPRTEAELESIKGEVVEDVSKVEGVVKPEVPTESAKTKEKEPEVKKE